MPTMTEPAPLGAMVKDYVWPTFGYEPHRGQQRIHRSSARHRLASCGRRFGKSKGAGSEIVIPALQTKTLELAFREADYQCRGWIVGPNYDDDEREFRVFYNACKKLEIPFDRPGTYYSLEGGNMAVSLWDGLFILECRSAAHPESLDGEGLDFVIMAEAAKMKESVWNKFIRPALADKQGWSLWNTTPEGRNWFYEMHKRGLDPNYPEWESWRMPSWMNNIIFPGGRNDPEILEMKADMSDEFFAQEIAADFTDFVGRVFKSWNEEVHVRDLVYDPRYPVYAACDYGWTNPFVWLLIQVDVFDNVYVIGEYRCTQRDTNEIGSDLEHWHGGLSTRVKTFYPDPAEPGDTRILSKALGIEANTNTGGELKHRLEYIRKWLKVGPEHAPEEEKLPKLFVDRSCKGLIYEMGEYRYPERKKEEKEAPEIPMDKDDHGPEALGRFFRGYFGAPASNRGRARQRKANYARRAA